jgi:hypothetical protein
MVPKKTSSLCLFVFVMTQISLGCSGAIPSSPQEFEVPSESGRAQVRLALPRLETAIKEKGLPPLSIQAVQVSLQVDKVGASEAIDRAMGSHLQVTFFGMTKEHCEVASRVYAGGWGERLSSVDCSQADGTRPFLLEDFLTPAMQATAGLGFRSELTSTIRDLTQEESERFRISQGGRYESQVFTDTNCWSAVYEVLRRSGGSKPMFTLHIPPKTVVQKIMSEDASYSKLLSQQEPVRFGDYLIVREADDTTQALSSSESISHAAVFIDEGIVFEKVGNSGFLPFRIATLRDSLAPYQSDRLVLEKRRLLKDLPDPEQLNYERRTVESSEGTVYDTTQVLRSIHLVRSQNGRWRLSEFKE